MKLFQKDPHFYKKVLMLALPIALQSLIAVGVNMLDTIMLGRVGTDLIPEIGEDAAKVVSSNSVSAAAYANNFIGVYHILCMGLGMGASVLVSRYWGMKLKGDDEPVDGKPGSEGKATRALKQTICLMLRLTLGLAIIFATVTALFPEQIIRMYVNADDPQITDIVARGVGYLRYSVITYFFLGSSLTVTIVLRSVGQALYPLFVSIGALFVNLIANYMLIFGRFGAPRMETEGAALGTLIARVFEAVLIVTYLLVVDKRIRFRIKHMFLSCGSLLKEYIRISIPVLVSDGLLAFGNVAFGIIIGQLGFGAANSVTQVTQQMSTVGIQGVCQAGAIVTGQTLGTGDKEKTMRQGWMFLGLGLALGTVSALFIFGFRELILSGYDITVADKDIANELMDAISLIIIFQATNSIMTKGVLRGGGDTKMLMLMDNVFLWAVALPLGALSGFVFHLAPFWIYICLKSDQIIKTIWCFFRLKSEKWIKKISTGSPAAHETKVAEAAE